MIQEFFVQRNSAIHRLDPRVKIVFITLYSFVVALSSELSCLLFALFLSWFLTGLAQLNPITTAKRLVFVNSLIFFLWVVLPVTYDGEPLFHMGPILVSREGVLLCVRITLKSNAILLTLIAMVASMSIASLGYALSRLHVPSKIVYLLLMTYRYIFVIEQEYERLLKAAMIRGFRPKTNMHTYRTYAYFIGMLFVRAAERAERVHQAMLCRGFNGNFYCLRDFSASRGDWFWSAILASFIIGLGILEWTKWT